MGIERTEQRAREQCFLISFVKEIAEKNGGDFARGDNMRDFEESLADDVAVTMGNRTYSHFVSVMSKSPSSIVNRLVTDPGLQQMFELNPAQMSALMPKMRFFKVKYDGRNDRIGETTEFIFENTIDPMDITLMTLNKQGRAKGVGVKAFDWILKGTNTAEIENNIEANLTLYFQNFKDLLSDEALNFVVEAASRGANLEQDVSNDFIASFNQEKANYLDFIFRSSKFTEIEDPDRGQSNREYNENYYRIKAVLGWSIERSFIGGQDNPGPGKLFSTSLAEKIEGTGTVLLLNLLTHDIDFREDGTIQLKLKYNAAVEGVMTSDAANIFWSRSLERRRLEMNAFSEELSAETAEDDPETPEIPEGMPDGEPENDDCSPDPGSERVSEETGFFGFFGAGQDVEEQIEEDLEEATEAHRRSLSAIYTRLLRRIRGTGGMYYIDVPEEVFDEHKDWGYAVSDLGGFNDLVSGRARASEASEAIGEYIENMQDELLDDPMNEDLEEVADDIASGQGAGGQLPVADDDGAGDTKRIYYFYLGYLIEQAMIIIERNPDLDPGDFANLRLILGTVMMGVPKFRNRRRLRNEDGDRIRNRSRLQAKKILINIADIPISVNLFLQFFNEIVIRPGLETWPLLTFLKDIFQKLVSEGMGTSCPDFGYNRRPRLGITHFNAYSGPDGIDRLLLAPIQEGIDPGIDPDTRFGGRRLIDSEIPLLSNSTRLEDRITYTYMIIGSSDISTDRIATDPDAPERDADEGIYWLNIGNPRGLVKSIKFKKTKQKGLPEARQERTGTISLGQLRDKYDADVTLFGNALFQPGQIIYINPTTMGLGSPAISTRLSSIMGMGGYYQIIKVDSNISDKYYETTLDTLWVASGTGETRDEDEECS